MGVDPGGMEDIPPPPPYFRWADGLYYHPPNISRLNVIFYRQNKCTNKLQTKLMTEITGFECRNVKIFLTRSARSHT